MKDDTDRFITSLSADLSDLVSNSSSPEDEFKYKYFQSRFRKRLVSQTDQALLGKAALKAFRDRNSSLKSPVLTEDVILEARSFIERALWNYTTSVDEFSVQSPIHLDTALSLYRHGPGASHEVSGTHAAQKFGEPFTVTTACKRLLQTVIAYDPHLSPFYWEDDMIVSIKGSKLTTVPKNETSVRTIAIEPSGNMFIQLSLGAYLEGVLSMIGFDIRSQQIRNRRLACLGSIDGSLATIDLSAASDSITIELVRLLFPPEWFALFMCTRSPYTLIDGEQVKLNMISTMGNGYTFPMMTLIFLSLVYANRRKSTKASRPFYLDRNKTAVFGDDIIVPTEEALGLIEILEQAGFTVNTAKSFSEGPFRESCGGDYYRGVFITPPYVRSVSQVSDKYVALNQLVRYCGRHNIWLPRTFQLLKDLIPEPFLVPEWNSDDSGFRTSVVERRFKLLEPAPSRFRYIGDFELMLALGGYISPSGNSSYYVPRPFKTRYRTVKSRLPRGYLDGRSSVDYSDRESDFASFVSFWLKGT